MSNVKILTKGHCLCFLLFALYIPSFAQGLIIGQPMPQVTFKRIINTDNQEISLENLKGKNVIIYTWAVFCAPCIEAFPEMNKLRDQNSDDLEIIMISFDPYDRVKQIFDRQLQIGRNITLPQAILTGEEWKKLSLTKADGFGSSIWIDKNGIYQGSAEINQENVSHFIAHGKPKTLKFFKYAKANRDFTAIEESIRKENFNQLKNYNPKKPLLFANQESNVRAGSIFTGYNPNYPDQPPMIIIFKGDEPIGIRLVNALHSLIYWPANSIQHSVDTSTGIFTSTKSRVINHRFATNYSKEQFYANKFNLDSLLIAKGICYELILPEGSGTDITNLLEIMRSDLDRYFGFSSTIEFKKCLALIRIDNTDLTSTNTRTLKERDNFGLNIQNGSVDDLTKDIYYFLSNRTRQEFAYIIDKTEIKYPITLKIVADMTDLKSVRTALQKHGLDLIETEDSVGEVFVTNEN